MIRSNKILRSARGERCTVGLPECNDDTETTVFAHISDEYKGMAIKASDSSGCYACSSCHAVIDGHVQSTEFQEHKYFYLLRAYQRTNLRLHEKGVILVA